MSITISVMIGGSYIISGQKPEGRIDIPRHSEVYRCGDCSGYEHKSHCLYKHDAEKDADRSKIVKINEQWEELKEESHTNIQSEKGILKRQSRSI